MIYDKNYKNKFIKYPFKSIHGGYPPDEEIRKALNDEISSIIDKILVTFSNKYEIINEIVEYLNSKKDKVYMYQNNDILVYFIVFLAEYLNIQSSKQSLYDVDILSLLKEIYKIIQKIIRRYPNISTWNIQIFEDIVKAIHELSTKYEDIIYVDNNHIIDNNDFSERSTSVTVPPITQPIGNPLRVSTDLHLLPSIRQTIGNSPIRQSIDTPPNTIRSSIRQPIDTPPDITMLPSDITMLPSDITILPPIRQTIDTPPNTIRSSIRQSIDTPPDITMLPSDITILPPIRQPIDTPPDFTMLPINYRRKSDKEHINLNKQYAELKQIFEEWLVYLNKKFKFIGNLTISELELTIQRTIEYINTSIDKINDVITLMLSSDINDTNKKLFRELLTNYREFSKYFKNALSIMQTINSSGIQNIDEVLASIGSILLKVSDTDKKVLEEIKSIHKKLELVLNNIQKNSNCILLSYFIENLELLLKTNKLKVFNNMQQLEILNELLSKLTNIASNNPRNIKWQYRSAIDKLNTSIKEEHNDVVGYKQQILSIVKIFVPVRDKHNKCKEEIFEKLKKWETFITNKFKQLVESQKLLKHIKNKFEKILDPTFEDLDENIKYAKEIYSSIDKDKDESLPNLESIFNDEEVKELSKLGKKIMEYNMFCSIQERKQQLDTKIEQIKHEFKQVIVAIFEKIQLTIKETLKQKLPYLKTIFKVFSTPDRVLSTCDNELSTLLNLLDNYYKHYRLLKICIKLLQKCGDYTIKENKVDTIISTLLESIEKCIHAQLKNNSKKIDTIKDIIKSIIESYDDKHTSKPKSSIDLLLYNLNSILENINELLTSVYDIQDKIQNIQEYSKNSMVLLRSTTDIIKKSNETKKIIEDKIKYVKKHQMK